MTSLALAYDSALLPCDLDDHSEVPCPGCHDVLEIHQPDQRQPERLLATCPSCSGWYFIDASASIMVRLSDVDALRDACATPVRRDRPAIISVDDFARAPSKSRRSRDGRPRGTGRSVGPDRSAERPPRRPDHP